MSLWKKLIRGYIFVSLILAIFAAIKFYPLLKGETPPEVTAIMNDLPQLEKIMDSSPIKTPAALMSLGALYMGKERYEDAERMYKKALALNPDHADTWFNLGTLYQKREMWPEAADAFEHCLKTKPDFSQAHNNLGIVYDALDRHDEAFKQYTEALSLEPDNPVLKENFDMAKEEHDRRSAEGLMSQASVPIPSDIPSQIQVPGAAPPSEMKIEVGAPMEDQPYFLRSPKKITLKNGRSVTGDVVDKDEEGMWLETGRGMRLHLSRSEVERIEDA